MSAYMCVCVCVSPCRAYRKGKKYIIYARGAFRECIYVASRCANIYNPESCHRPGRQIFRAENLECALGALCVCMCVCHPREMTDKKRDNDDDSTVANNAHRALLSSFLSLSHWPGIIIA